MKFMIWTEIGARIKKLRLDKGMTQETFGRLIGCTRQYVSKIEKGQKISIELIVVIARKTDASLDYLIFDVVNPITNIKYLKDFSPEQIAICLDIVNRIVKFLLTPNANELLIKELTHRKQERMAI